MKTARQWMVAGACLAMIPALAAQTAKPDPAAGDVILRAMRDELARSEQLRVISPDTPPYFISYSVSDTLNVSISASLGALMNVNSAHFRLPSVDVRVGSYDFDDTGYVGTGYYSGAGYELNQWPLDDDYDAIRQQLWLATDHAYKAAIESIGRKKAALKSVSNYDQLADFSKVPPVVSILNPHVEHPDMAQWTNRIVELSDVFKNYPGIWSSSVDFTCISATTYLANSEGTLIRYPDNLNMVRVRAESQAPDGMVVRDSASFQALDLNNLPQEDVLRKGIQEVADNVNALVHAPVGDQYVGPALFEPQAAAQLLAQLLGDNLRVPRRPVPEPGRAAPFAASDLEGRIGSRILPDWMDVVDDGTQTNWNNKPLLGFYLFDTEGVAPKPVSLVEKGILKNYLLTRQPVKGFPESNGHARLPGNYGAQRAAISNLFVKASGTVPLAQLKARLIEMCKERNKPYGILVRKLDYPSSASLQEVENMVSGLAQSGGGTHPVSLPILIYRVYPDGHEELIRGVRFRELSIRSLKDILAASSETAAFNFVNNGALFALIGVSGYQDGTTVVAPGLLFDEIELERPESELIKPPLVSPPPIGK